LLKEFVVLFDLFNLIADAFSLLLYILCFLIIKGLILFLLLPVCCLFLEKMFNLTKFGPVNNALLDVAFLLFNF